MYTTDQARQAELDNDNDNDNDKTDSARQAKLDNAEVVAGNSLPPGFPTIHPFA